MHTSILFRLLFCVALALPVTARAGETVVVQLADNAEPAAIVEGWNRAFSNVLLEVYGAMPSFSMSEMYRDRDGRIYVVSRFEVAGNVGSVLGLAFDPEFSESLGDGRFRYMPERGAIGFRSQGDCTCLVCEEHLPDKSIRRSATCGVEGSYGGCGLLDLDGTFEGSYILTPSLLTGLELR